MFSPVTQSNTNHLQTSWFGSSFNFFSWKKSKLTHLNLIVLGHEFDQTQLKPTRVYPPTLPYVSQHDK